jgi:hypothetical protein
MPIQKQAIDLLLRKRDEVARQEVVYRDYVKLRMKAAFFPTMK